MKLFRGRVFTPVADPFRGSDGHPYIAHDDGFVAVEGDRIAAVGPWSEHPPGAEVMELGSDALITPGFFDTHLHAPQLEMIGAQEGHELQFSRAWVPALDHTPRTMHDLSLASSFR